MTREEDERAFDLNPVPAYDGLMIAPVIQQGAIVQKYVIIGRGGVPAEFDTCMTCGALIHPEKISAHQTWHNAIRDTFQSQKQTNQSLSVSTSVTSNLLRSVRNLVSPLIFPPALPQESRSLKRRPRPKKGNTMSDIRKNENKAMDQADETTEDKTAPKSESYEQKVMDGLEKK